MRAMSMAAVISAAFTAGCLVEHGRVGDAADGDTGSDTGGGETVGDTGPDTGFETAADGDTIDVDRCWNVVCDDGDECTYDLCNSETGECNYYPMPGAGEAPGGGGAPNPSCLNDAECEDGDACTTNSCVGAGQCGAGGTCVYEPIHECGGCAAGCDDGDPCTLDECTADGQCYHLWEEGCLAGCFGPGQSPSQLTQPGLWDTWVKATGVLDIYSRGKACNDGPTCDCVGLPGLGDGYTDVFLRRVSSTFDEQWQCETHGCGEVVTACKEPLAGVRYRAWGRGLSEWDLFDPPAGVPDPGAVPAPMLAGIELENWCLETDDVALVGKYDGQLEIDGYPISLDVSIDETPDGGLALSWYEVTCESCPHELALEPGSVPVVRHDGWIEIEPTLPSIVSGSQPRKLRLYSNQNQLSGAYTDSNGHLLPAGVAFLSGARMTLTRLP